MSGKLLIVEDEFIISNTIRKITSKLGYGITGVVNNARDALDSIKSERPDLVLLDINILGDMNGIELSGKLKERNNLPYIYITSYSDTETLEEMNKTGPHGYILKPFDERDLRVALHLALGKLRFEETVPKKKGIPGPKQKGTVGGKGNGKIIGTSNGLRLALKKVAQVAPTDVTVLIQGETGVGKELIMEALYSASNRSSNNLVKVNCAALPSELIESVLFGHEKGSFTGALEKRLGKFEIADKGTIFLDEIGELPLNSQAKLLRCLQEKEIESVGGNSHKKIDVRVIAATNKDLAKDVVEGNFRADLFFRLNIFPITIPPLRERKEDIEQLAQYFLAKSAARFNKPNLRFSRPAIENMKLYHWPGNIRELQHVIERACLLTDVDFVDVALEHTRNPRTASSDSDFKLKSLEESEREQIMQTLHYCKGRIRGKNGAAEILKLHPNTLDFRIKKLGIMKENIYKIDQ